MVEWVLALQIQMRACIYESQIKSIYYSSKTKCSNKFNSRTVKYVLYIWQEESKYNRIYKKFMGGNEVLNTEMFQIKFETAQHIPSLWLVPL